MRILKEGSIYFGASVFERAIPFLLLPFLTRLLSTEEYGMISIFITVTAIFSLAIGLGLGGFVRVIYHKIDNRDFHRYVGNVLTIATASLLISIILIVFFQTNIVRISGLESDLIPLIIVVASAMFIVNLRLVIFQTMRMPSQYGKMQLSRPILDFSLVILLVFYLSGGGVERIYAFVASYVITGLIACFSLYRDGLLRMRLDKKSSSRALSFVLPLLPHSIALTAFSTADKLILASSTGLSIVGELAVALALASPTIIISESINRFFMPWSFEKFREGELELVVGASYVLLTLMAVICLGYSLLLTAVFEIIVGEYFLNAFAPVMILIWLGWLKLAYYLFAKGIVYREETRFLSYNSIPAGIVYIGLIVINIREITVVDVSIYMLAHYSIMFIGVLVLSQLRFPQPWGQVSSAVLVGRTLFDYFSRVRKTR